MFEIYNTKNESECCETIGPDYEEKFVKVLCEIIVDKLRIGWSDRNIVENLLYSTIIDKLENNINGLLVQYLHSQLDIIADTIKREFKLFEDVKVNYDYATHAKFNSIIESIKNERKEE